MNKYFCPDLSVNNEQVQSQNSILEKVRGKGSPNEPVLTSLNSETNQQRERELLWSNQAPWGRNRDPGEGFEFFR